MPDSPCEAKGDAGLVSGRGNAVYAGSMSLPAPATLRKVLQLPLAMAALALLVGSQTARADTPQLRVIPVNDLRFGSFAVMDTGYRVVRPDGSVQSSGIFSAGTSGTGPARFRVSYDRGNNGNRRLNLEIELRFAAAPVVTQGGIAAELTQYQSDLPGYANVAAGQAVTIRIPNCRTRVCETTFNLGGRLDVERSFGGGTVVLPIPVDAVLISVR